MSGLLCGWVSENYIALSRVYKWEYSQLEQIADDLIYAEPASSHSQWTGIQCEKWLMSHGLDKSGNVQVKKQRVAQYMQLPAGPPPLIGPKGGSVVDVVNVVKSIQAMISHIMTENIDDDVMAQIT